VTDRAPTVVVADDHDGMRGLVTGALNEGGFDVVGAAGDAAGAIDLVERHRPDACVLDVHMPGSGIDAARTIAASWPETSVVMLTVSRTDDDLFNALRAGAVGYLLKGDPPDVLAQRLRDVLDGEPALSPGLALRVLDEFRRAPTRRVFVRGRGHIELSKREAQVFELLREGLRTDQIARRLYVAPVTVRSHIASVLRKLNATDRDEAMRLLEH
jgi:two-component system nitrate/nitrite response regulator NarL